MLLNIDWASIVFALLLGYLDDFILPKYYHYENTVVGIYKPYQCPIYCGANHHHLVYHNKEITGYHLMYVDKSKLGKKYKKKKSRKKK